MSKYHYERYHVEQSGRLSDLTAQALASYERNVGVKLENDDAVYVWVYVNDAGEVESVEVNMLNHSPEGIFCEVRNLADIESWWKPEWSYPAE